MTVTNKQPRWLGKTSRALGIVRVSSKKQGDNNSPGVQRDGIRAYAVANGLDLVEVVQIEESAKSSEARVKFHAALEKAKKTKARHLVFWVWDRTTRNFTDYELLEDLIRRDDAVLHVAHERWALYAGSDEGDWLKAEMNTLVAKTYSRQLSRRAKESQDAKAKDGWYPTRPPIGYRNKKSVGANGVVKDRGGTIELTREGRALMRRMFDLRIAGASLDAIGVAVVKEGLWNAAGKRPRHLRRSEVEFILKHEFYVGWFTWRGERFRGKHEIVFSADEWERLQATFGKNAPYGSKATKRGAFTGFMRCATCGCLICYDPKEKPSGKRYEYYRCTNGHRVHTKHVYVTEDKLIDQFQRVIADIDVPTALLDEVARDLRETHEATLVTQRTEATRLRKTVDELQEREDKTVALYVDGKLDDAAYKRLREKQLNEKHDAIDRLNAANGALDDGYLMNAERVFELAKKARSLWNRHASEGRRQLLEKLVSNPTLDGVTVRYEMKTPLAILAEMARGGDWRARHDSNVRPPDS